MKTAATYARTSTQLQESEKTIDSQIEAIESYAAKNEYQIVMRYADDGYSGELLVRPALDRLRDDAQKKMFDAVIFYDVSRLSRKYPHQAIIIEELEDSGIDVLFLDTNKAVTSDDKILGAMKGVMAEYEREKIKERTRRGRLYKARCGKLVGHEAPYGYSYIPKSKDFEAKYEINENEAKSVRMIFDWVGNKGYSLNRVRKELFNLKVRAKKSNKISWQNSTLSRMLRRTDYIGLAYYNKTQTIIPFHSRIEGYKRTKKTGRNMKAFSEWIPINIPQIIDKDLFNRTSEMLKKNSLFSKRNQRSEYLLSGLLYCGCGCSARMTGDGQGKYRYYRSTDRVNKFPEKKVCTQLSARVDVLDDLVWKKVSTVLNNPQLLKKQLVSINEQKERSKASIELKKAEILAEQAKNNTEEERVVTAYRQNIISLVQLNSQLEQTRKRKIELDVLIKELQQASQYEAASASSDIVDKYLKLMQKRLSEFTFEDKQQILRLLVEKIEVKDGVVTINGIVPEAEVYDASEIIQYSNKYNLLQLSTNDYHRRASG